jgi:signal peptidase I
MDHVPESPGDHVLVNKSVFDLRRPRRWEMVVFRCPSEAGKAFVKRILGLPGERLRIRDGDIYVNGVLARKTLEEFRSLRIPVFDNNYQPKPHGFRDRWESNLPSASFIQGTVLLLQGDACKGRFHTVTYRHYSLDERQCVPIRDEYAYNCGDARSPTAVHNLMMECDVRPDGSQGAVRCGITDGSNWITAELPIGRTSRAKAILREVRKGFDDDGKDSPALPIYRKVADGHLDAGRTYHIELAFVDRRITLAVDGRLPFEPLDLPAAEGHRPIVRPVQLGAMGINAVVSNFRLFRDIYYTAAGSNGVRSVVSLGPDEYFVLGDNSPNSDDSRFWPNHGAVPGRLLIGKPFLAHLPSRVVRWEFLGQERASVVPDWGRIRWLR